MQVGNGLETPEAESEMQHVQMLDHSDAWMIVSMSMSQLLSQMFDFLALPAEGGGQSRVKGMDSEEASLGPVDRIRKLILEWVDAPGHPIDRIKTFLESEYAPESDTQIPRQGLLDIYSHTFIESYERLTAGIPKRVLDAQSTLF